MILNGQKMQLKLVSDKYDTSQVKLYVDSAFKEIDHKGKCNFKGSNCYQNGGTPIVSAIPARVERNC